MISDLCHHHLHVMAFLSTSLRPADKQLCIGNGLIVMVLATIQKYKLTTMGNTPHSIGTRCELA